MRRSFASLLLALFSYMLIAPLMAAQSEPDVPACCRKTGAHRCAMSHRSNTPTGGVALQPTERCPFFPVASGSVSESHFAAPATEARWCVSCFSYPSGAVQTEAYRRISFTRSSQKRGPPAGSPQSLAC